MFAAVATDDAPAAEDYSPLTKGLGIAGAVFFSVIALVVTLVALSSEQSPLKRSFLKLCAGISAAAIVIPLVMFVIVASSGGGGGGGTESKGPCVGGPDMGATGTPTSNGDVIFPCAISGSTKVHLGNGP
jgi:hypothetical protein